MNEREIEAWITKYALTQGVFKIRARVCITTRPDGDMIQEITTLSSTPSYYHGKGVDWHETKEEALVRADEMRKRKVASLRKKIAALEEMRFE